MCGRQCKCMVLYVHSEQPLSVTKQCTRSVEKQLPTLLSSRNIFYERASYNQKVKLLTAGKNDENIKKIENVYDMV